MRKSFWPAALFLALAAVGAGAYLGHRAPPPPAPPPVVAALPAPEPAPPAPEPAKPKEELPTVVIGQRPVHSVREDENLPIPTVTLMTREGKVIARATPRPPPPPSTVPANAPAAAPQPVLPARLGGNARPVGGARLSVGGNTLQLFGVLTPLAKQCSLGSGAPQPCADAARLALQARLEANAIVTCEMPAGQRGPPSFICRDWSGIDLGGYLVGEGLALADTNSSPAYLGAQDVARTYQRGVWHAR